MIEIGVFGSSVMCLGERICVVGREERVISIFWVRKFSKVEASKSWFDSLLLCCREVEEGCGVIYLR